MLYWKRTKVFADQRGHVLKLVFERKDAVAETVVYRYPDYTDRTVICCSVQSGCPVGCTFCGTGRRFVRNLSAYEIVDQVTTAMNQIVQTKSRDIKKLQIMFMSMGEPLLNWVNVRTAVRQLHTWYPQAELLLSTIAPRTGMDTYMQLLALSKRIRQVGLQVSVHAATDADRDKVVPYSRKLTLQEISEFGETWHRATRRHPVFNYCIPGTGEPRKAADRLARIFSPETWHATLSVICSTARGQTDVCVC